MKLILVNQRYGHTRTIVIRGWMKGLLSVCLLGAPLALACLGYELALADASPGTVLSQNARVAADEFIQSQHDEACQDCMAYVLFDEDIEQTANHPGVNDFAVAAQSATLLDLQSIALALVTESSSVSLAVYSHGRLVDPARYARVTLNRNRV